jgi:hypothetical protein
MDSLDHWLDFVKRTYPLNQRHKLITAETHDMFALPHATGQPTRDFAKDAVANQVPVGIIHLLEVVQIDK